MCSHNRHAWYAVEQTVSTTFNDFKSRRRKTNFRLVKGFVLRSQQELEVFFQYHLKCQAKENFLGLEELLKFSGNPISTLSGGF